MLRVAAAALAAAHLCAGASAAAMQCYQMVQSGRPVQGMSCGATTEYGLDMCLLMCGVCTTPELAVGLDPAMYNSICGTIPDPDNGTAVVSAVVGAVANVSAMQGYFWLDDPGDIEANQTECFTYLFAHMPRRDMMLLFSQPFQFIDFLVEHVRYALATRAWSAALGVPWDLFLDSVLPYAVLDEKRDLWWRWRPRFAQLFGPLVAGAPNVTAAMRALANAIPEGEPAGLLGLVNGTAQAAVPGQPITWRSSVSPAYISPQQVAAFGGSCTGTGIVLVAAARAVGIPARIAGCSESVVRGDDHHWAEFYDPSEPGPFGDFWHTKEGTSAGNAGGPWDSPSGPMLGCLQGVVPGSSIDSMWAGSWGSSTYLPALWANDTWSAQWSFMGGVNRCGQYCTAWGCGANNSMHWAQAECQPSAAWARR